MTKYFIRSLAAILAILLSGCLELPTIEITPTTVPTTPQLAATARGTPMSIKITGDVYVRDNQGKVIGWLDMGVASSSSASKKYATSSSSNSNLPPSQQRHAVLQESCSLVDCHSSNYQNKYLSGGRLDGLALPVSPFAPDDRRQRYRTTS